MQKCLSTNLWQWFVLKIKWNPCTNKAKTDRNSELHTWQKIDKKTEKQEFVVTTKDKRNHLTMNS